jgi:CxxC-x17-CxxC domain-containing protein
VIEKEIGDDWASSVDNEAMEGSGDRGGRRDGGGRDRVRDRGSRDGDRKNQKKVFRDFCWVCGEETDISFQPDGRRPIYCKNCYDGVQDGEIIPPTKPKKFESVLVKKLSNRGTLHEEKKPDVNLDELRKALQSSLGKLQIDNQEKKDKDQT